MGGPCYWGWRLDRSLAEFRRAVDRLRWDTDPRRGEQPATRAPAPQPTPDPDRAGQPRLACPPERPGSLVGRDPQGTRATPPLHGRVTA